MLKSIHFFSPQMLTLSRLQCNVLSVAFLRLMFEQNLQHRILCGKNRLRILHDFWFGKEIELKNCKQNNVVK